MKPVLLIAMVAVAMIGVMVPSVTAETYNFKNLHDVQLQYLILFKKNKEIFLINIF
jgi:hypothetical protein